MKRFLIVVAASGVIAVTTPALQSVGAPAPTLA
jgi:hypothetical protein